MCSKQLWEQHGYFLATQNMIIMMTTITLLQLMGIIPTKGTSRKCNDCLGEKVKSSTSIHIYWTGSVTVSPKPSSVRTLCWKNLNLNSKRVVELVYSFRERKNHLQTPIRWESQDFSCHSTEPTQKAWKPQFWPGISLSLVWLPHSTFVKAGQPVQSGLSLCNF